MSEVRYIQYAGKKILQMDFSKTLDEQAVSSTVSEAIKIVAAAKEPKSLLGLVDFTGCPFTKPMTGSFKRLSAHNRPYMRFIALVGLGPVRSALLRLMLFAAGRSNHRLFRTRQQALDWLAEQ